VSTRLLDLDGRRLMLSGLDRELWPEVTVTKGDLVDYYLDKADYVLPYLAQRPLSLLRWTDGLGGECLYQKSAPPGLPAWVPTRRIRSEHAALGYSDHIVGGDRATLVYLVNLGCISHHPWSCTVDALDRPDQLLFDLDPTEIAFREVRNAAMLIRDLLAHFRLRSWVKTSGGAGLHVIVPLAPAHSFEQVLTAAETITRMARSREPSLFTLDMRRARPSRQDPDRRPPEPPRRDAHQPLLGARASAGDRLHASRVGGTRTPRVSRGFPHQEHRGPSAEPRRPASRDAHHPPAPDSAPRGRPRASRTADGIESHPHGGAYRRSLS
jgi:DNA ligase D-like protein (predicted polymerase)